LPGMLYGRHAARHSRPIFIRRRPMPRRKNARWAPVDLISVFEGVGAYRPEDDAAELKTLEDFGCPSCGIVPGHVHRPTR